MSIVTEITGTCLGGFHRPGSGEWTLKEKECHAGKIIGVSSFFGQAEKKEKSAMLELDDPGSTDGERHRPGRLY